MEHNIIDNREISQETKDKEFYEKINDPNFLIARSKNAFDPSEQEEYDYSVHIDELIKEVLAYHSNESLEKLEEISLYIKKKISKLSLNHKITPKIPSSILDMTEYEKQILKQINNKKTTKLAKVNNLMDDILEKAKILEWAGVNFGRNIWYQLKLSMKKIMTLENCISLKFFGKIYGINSDYYILYGKLKDYPAQKYPKPPSQHFEPKGLEGVNAYTFWVSNNFLEDWYQLPDVYPHHMAQSMLFKYYFTGDLKAKVKSFIPFNGTEAHMLKCQVLRIMHACFIVPDGYLESKTVDKVEEVYGLDISDKLTQVKEDFVVPTSNEELLSIDKWNHEFNYIYPNGKIIETNTEAEKIPAFRGISQDTRKYKLIFT